MSERVYELLRRYEPNECWPDGVLAGYPHSWTACEFCGGAGTADVGLCDYCLGTKAIKDLVRHQAGHRCVRCGHPFRVGASGEMDGPHANAKGFAADLGLSIEDFDQVMMAVEADLTMHDHAALKKSPRTNWSDCDRHCHHTGPMRVQTTEGWRPFNPTPEACGPAVAAVRPAKAQAAWRILTVHHLNGDKADCRWWNLAALCQRCHLKIQRTVNLAQIWPHEHTAWFKPYAAGYYAATYLGEELTREETMERLDELLALERIA